MTEESCTQNVVVAKVTEIEGIMTIPYNFVVSDDLQWHICLDSRKLSPSVKVFSTMPQTISSLSDVQTVTAFLDSLVVCCGNEGETFRTLITTRKGSFLNASGNYSIMYTNYFTTHASYNMFFDLFTQAHRMHSMIVRGMSSVALHVTYSLFLEKG